MPDQGDDIIARRGVVLVPGVVRRGFPRRVLTMKRLLSLLAILFAVRIEVVQAQSPGPTANPVGVWRGTSLCLVRPSACNDETVVYRIANTKVADSLSLDGRKIVGGEEQGMGVLSCRFASPSGSLTCALPQGTWQFIVRNDSLVGELRRPDGAKLRDVKTVRVP